MSDGLGYWLKSLICLFVTVALGVASSSAQEKPPAEPAAQTEKPKEKEAGKPQDTGKPEEAPKPAPTAKPGQPAEAPDADAATKDFQNRMEEWKTLLKDLRALKVKYQTAKEPETAEIQKQWDTLIAKGEQMLPQLRASALAAYLAAPNVDLALSRFLVKALADDVQRDDFEAAYALGKALIDNGCELKEIYDHTGVAAFALNDFANAEKYLNEASAAGALNSKLGMDFKGLIKEYQGYWEAESKIREEEAKKNDLPRVKLATSKGDIIVELFENEAPETVGNFVSLVESKFYDGKTFHRVLPGFMAQGGCPIGDGTGDAGYKIYCECYKDNYRRHFRGSLSMAKGAAKDTGGTQFFMTFVPTPHLNGKHTVFGRVIEGIDVLAKIQRIDPSQPGGKPTPDKIVTAELLRKRDHKYEPNPVK